MNNNIDVFELAKSVDFRTYIETFYNIDFDRTNKAICPFCGSSDTPAFSIHKQKPIVKCFSCMPKAMGIVDFVMNMHNCTDLEAAKKICNDMGLIIENNENIKEQALELQKKQEAALKLREKKQKEQETQTKKLQEKTIKSIEKNAPTYLQNILIEENKKHLQGLFNLTNKFWAWYFSYIGYDDVQESICIINQNTKTNEFYNIKHRQKYIWDEKNKQYDKSKRMQGKWISQANSKQFPFPYDYFIGNPDERVVLCFGEKDALNLLSLGVNTLTLGGINNSFEDFADMFKNKVVYIFPDNQAIEYLCAMARYKELEKVAKDIYIVSFFHIDNSLEQKYDVSDFILEKNFALKEDFFRAIEYSCFKLTNAFIEDVKDFFYADAKLTDRFDAFLEEAKTKTFAQIAQEILKVAKPVKSELDVEISRCELQLLAIKDHPLKKEFLHFLGNKYQGEKFVEELEKAMAYKKSLFGQFRKQYEADVTEALVADIKRSGYDVANYRNDVLFWTGSHYEKITEKELKFFIFQKWMKTANVNKKQHTPDFMHKVAIGVFYSGVALENIKEKQDYRVINFDNGTAYLYSSGKFVFKPLHVKEDACLSILPFKYDKEAKAPKWKRFLSEVLPDKIEQNALMEFIGYCFLPTHNFQKFLFLLGSGANGKSIVLNVIRKFFSGSVSNVDLQQLYGHEMIGIEGKYVNIGSEINPRGLGDGQMESLKKLTAGEPTQLNPKNSTPYDVIGADIPKFIFSGNSKPQGNLDDGLFRRMLLLNFAKVIQKKERIIGLDERFNDELSGIFNLAMQGLERLLNKNDFSMSSEMKRNMDEYKEDANPVLAYINENISTNKNVMVSRKFLYIHYKTWCEERGHHPTSDRTFFSRMKDVLQDIEVTQPNYSFNYSELLGARPRFVRGIRLINGNIDMISVNKIDIKTQDLNIDVLHKCVIRFDERASENV